MKYFDDGKQINTNSGPINSPLKLTFNHFLHGDDLKDGKGHKVIDYQSWWDAFMANLEKTHQYLSKNYVDDMKNLKNNLVNVPIDKNEQLATNAGTIINVLYIGLKGNREQTGAVEYRSTLETILNHFFNSEITNDAEAKKRLTAAWNEFPKELRKDAVRAAATEDKAFLCEGIEVNISPQMKEFIKKLSANLTNSAPAAPAAPDADADADAAADSGATGADATTTATSLVVNGPADADSGATGATGATGANMSVTGNQESIELTGYLAHISKYANRKSFRDPNNYTTTGTNRTPNKEMVKKLYEHRKEPNVNEDVFKTLHAQTKYKIEKGDTQEGGGKNKVYTMNDDANVLKFTSEAARDENKKHQEKLEIENIDTKNNSFKLKEKGKKEVTVTAPPKGSNTKLKVEFSQGINAVNNEALLTRSVEIALDVAPKNGVITLNNINNEDLLRKLIMMVYVGSQAGDLNLSIQLNGCGYTDIQNLQEPSDNKENPVWEKAKSIVKTQTPHESSGQTPKP